LRGLSVQAGPQLSGTGLAALVVALSPAARAVHAQAFAYQLSGHHVTTCFTMLFGDPPAIKICGRDMADGPNDAGQQRNLQCREDHRSTSNGHNPLMIIITVGNTTNHNVPGLS